MSRLYRFLTDELHAAGQLNASGNQLVYSTYAGGGSIRLNVGGAVNGGLSNSWLVTDYDANGLLTVMPNYSGNAQTPSTEGIVAMAGLEQSVQHHDHFGIPARILAALRQTGEAPLVVLDATIRGY